MRHLRGFDGEVFHTEGGFEITEFHFDLPALHVEVGHFSGGIFHGVQEVGDDDEGGFFSGPVFVTHLDVAQGHLIGKLRPLFVGEFAGLWLFDGLFPGHEAFDGADFFSSAPVEFAMPGLVEAHDDVAFFPGGDSRDIFVGAEGAVAKDDVAFIDVFEQARGHPGVVLLEAACFKSFDASVAEVDHADDAHDGEAAADFLAAVLGVFFLVLQRVHEGDAGAVDGFELVPAPGIPGLDSLFEGRFDLTVDAVEKAVFDAFSGLAVCAGVASRDG